MKSAFWLVFICILTHHTGFTQTASPGTKQRAILDTEARRFVLMTRADTAALRPLLAADLVYIHSNALTETRSEHLRAIASGRLVYQSMQREAAQARLYGRTAITNGIVKVAGILNGTAFELRLRYTAVYRRQHGQWQLANWQSTKL